MTHFEVLSSINPPDIIVKMTRVVGTSLITSRLHFQFSRSIKPFLELEVLIGTHLGCRPLINCLMMSYHKRFMVDVTVMSTLCH